MAKPTSYAVTLDFLQKEYKSPTTLLQCVSQNLHAESLLEVGRAVIDHGANVPVGLRHLPGKGTGRIVA